MKVSTPFGRHPFQFRYVEVKDGELSVIGTVVGLESGLVLERRELAIAAGLVAAAAAITIGRRRAKAR